MIPELTFLYAQHSQLSKRFNLESIQNLDIQSVTLYWYLDDIPYNSAQVDCNCKMIEDYGVLEYLETVNVIHDYGKVMDYDETPGWISLDVTTKILENLTEDFIAFYWYLSEQVPNDTIQSFQIAAYEEVDYRAYLAVEYVMGKINIGDDWKDIDEIQINIGDSWKTVDEVYIQVGGIWRLVHG
jgi:hypothetical protein